MDMSPELAHQVFSLPVHERYELAQQLLDSIDDSAAAAGLDEALIAELRRRREEMLRGDETVADWRAALSAIEGTLPVEKQA